jgi:integrase
VLQRPSVNIAPAGVLRALRTGLRFGELVGLQWGDFDFNGGFIDIRRSVGDGGRVELPRNKRIRRIDMSRQLADELQRLKAERAREALVKGWGKPPRFHDLRHTFASRPQEPIRRRMPRKWREKWWS